MASTGGDREWVMVVEYLESTMSKDLLGKFPDNSAYDFDYSQSSIWSPLINRGLVSSSDLNPSSSKGALSFGFSRKLLYDQDIVMGLTKIKKFSTKIKRKFTDTLFYNLQKYQKMKRRKKKKKKNKSIDFSPVPSSVTPRQGWEKVLKAATKHFKKKNKRRDSVGLFP